MVSGCIVKAVVCVTLKIKNTMNMDIDAIRADFPILKEKVYGKDLVYFDNAATGQKPQCVLDKIVDVYSTQNSNIHRGVHYLSQKATMAHEEARERIARFIGANHAREIIFTRGTTESINLVATCYCDRYCSEGDEIVITAMEHHANIVPWQMAAERKGLKLRVAGINERGELDMEELKGLLNERTRLIAVAHASNVLGTINPIKEIITLAHEKGIHVMVDGAQAVAHTKVNVQELDADFYVFSGHKLYGPNGIGVLYGKEHLLDEMPPYQGGGEMIAQVSFEKTTYNELPFKYEAGTPDYVGSVALCSAIDYIENIGLEAIGAYEDELLQYATAEMKKIPGMRIIGEAKEKCSLISFLVGNIHPFDLGMLLDKMGIAIRTGHHCAQPLIDLLGLPGTARASFSFYNNKTEIDYFITQLKRAISILES